MKVLLIGGTGPTGPFIVRGLEERGHQVVLLNRGKHSLAELSHLQTIQADPHFAESLEGALAGQEYDAVVATYGRLRIMPEIVSQVTGRFVTVGGANFEDRGGLPAAEDSPRQTDAGLLRQIVHTEQVLREGSELHGYNWTHLRYPCLWGPRQLAPREWSVLRRAIDRRPFVPVLDGGLTMESLAYVENAAHAVLLTIDQPEVSRGQIYNVADQVTVTDAARVRALATEMGVEMGLLELPRVAYGPAAFWGVNRDLAYAAEARAPFTTHRILDTTRIRTELGFRDVVPFEEAVRRTVAWYREHPIEPGSELEKQLADPFDYVAEDKFAKALADFGRRTAAIEFAAAMYRHPYSHPAQAESAQPLNS